MVLRSGHGNGKGAPRIEVLPADEQPHALPQAGAPPSATLYFRSNGQIGDSETARELGKRGGASKARKVRLVDSLGLAHIVEGSAFAPYRTAAEEFVKHHLEALAAVAGGSVGPGPSTMVASAALQLGASRFCFDHAASSGDTTLMKLGSSLANDSRQNLMAAHEMAVREGQHARPTDPRQAFTQALEAVAKEQAK